MVIRNVPSMTAPIKTKAHLARCADRVKQLGVARIPPLQTKGAAIKAKKRLRAVLRCVLDFSKGTKEVRVDRAERRG